AVLGRPALQGVLGAAIGALGVPLGGDVEKHARMLAPQRHRLVRAERRQVLRFQFHRGLLGRAHARSFFLNSFLPFFATGFVLAVLAADFAAPIGVSHLAYFLFLPLTMSKNADWIFSVTGPRRPAPMVRPSSSRTGVTSAAVPEKKVSSAM